MPDAAIDFYEKVFKSASVGKNQKADEVIKQVVEDLLRAIFEKSLRVAHPVAGHAQLGDDGTLGLHVRDQSGRLIRGSGSYVDVQSEYSSNQTSGVVGPAESAVEHLVNDESQPVSVRAAAVEQWLIRDSESASEFILYQLEAGGLLPEWLEVLILAAEHARYPQHADQQRLVDALLSHASALRHDRRASARATVNSALRRAGSLIDVGRLDRFAEFLAAPTAVDTRLVTVQTIVRILETESPLQGDEFPQIADRINALVTKLIDPDLLMPGSNAALALEGLVALKLLAPSAGDQKIDLARSLGIGWFNQMLERRIGQLARDVSLASTDYV